MCYEIVEAEKYSIRKHAVLKAVRRLIIANSYVHDYNGDFILTVFLGRKRFSAVIQWKTLRPVLRHSFFRVVEAVERDMAKIIAEELGLLE